MTQQQTHYAPFVTEPKEIAMPVVFGSLERWFRLHKEDFHEIVLADGEGVTNINSSLLAWIA